MPPKVSLHLLKALPEAVELPSAGAFAHALERAGATGGEVNLILTGAAEVRRLNREFRGKDRPTDVIAFDYTDGGEAGSTHAGHGKRVWGDVFVSAEVAREQALARGLAVREELARLFLHGCLHLLGHRDRTTAELARMEAVQESLLRDLLDPPPHPGAAAAKRRRRASAPRRRS